MLSPRIPVATYRLQFNPQFRFHDALEITGYLHRLGISDLYASPIFKSRPGSSHGYDITDPTCLDPELGTEEQFNELVRQLKQHDMGLLLDIVPNHMAISSENPWLMDLLENGIYSPYATFFDIDWNPPSSTLENKIVLPILGSPYEQALESQELVLKLEDAGLFMRYHDHKLPLDVKTYGLVFGHSPKAIGGENLTFQQLSQLAEDMKRLPAITAAWPAKDKGQYRERQRIKATFLQVVNASPEARDFLLENIALLNGKKGRRESFRPLDSLLSRQAYKLAFWKEAREQINYRRFFDISDLIGVRVEEAEVFEATHSLILCLVRENKASGLRVDHIDGLRDPQQYLERLQQHLTPAKDEADQRPLFYMVVEKILSGDEALPEEWPVSDSTGYDFLNRINALFVDSSGAQALDGIYSSFTGSSESFAEIVREKKKQVMKELFPAETKALSHRLADIARQYDPGFSPEELAKALIEVTACLPVYRTYTRNFQVLPRDRKYLESAFHETSRRNKINSVALDFLRCVLFLEFPPYLATEQKKAWLRLVLRWQQLSGAVMAKGFEDTALYTYNRLTSLNEVGGNPASAGLSISEFHQYNLARLERWPHTLNATSTHDTKRSEDVRARINVLSEMPEEWERHLTRWRQCNRTKKPEVSGLPVPEPNMEMLLYQTLIGAWPLSEKDTYGFKERLKAYMVKAAREARASTSWLSPDSAYENSIIAFIDSILADDGENEFLKDFLQFQRQIAFYGALNALAQALLKIASPGVPDFYQGTELWDFSLVDPDNRRPVNFSRRMKLLDELSRQENKGQLASLKQILESWEDGRVKLYLTYKALNLRKSCPDVFEAGRYVPLKVAGQRQEHVCAFARLKGESWVLAAVPRFFTKLCLPGEFPLEQRTWGDDRLLLPEGAPLRWLNAFSGEKLMLPQTGKEIPVSDIFRIFPVALLKNI